MIVSPWVAPSSVFTEDFRHTSLIATLREVWGLGRPFSARDATARTFQHVLSLEEPRDPVNWPSPVPVPVPQFQMERVAAGEAIGTLGKYLSEGLFEHMGRSCSILRLVPKDREREMSPRLALAVVHLVAKRYFPRLSGPPGSRLRAIRAIITEYAQRLRGRRVD